MNRRGFLNSIIRLGVSSMILPGALSYTRKWKRSSELYLPNPDYINAEREVVFFYHPDTFKLLKVWPSGMGKTTRSIL